MDSEEKPLLLIPTYKRAYRLPKLVEQFSPYFDIVFCTQTTDNEGYDIAAELSKTHSVGVIHILKVGVGYARRELMEHAQYLAKICGYVYAVQADDDIQSFEGNMELWIDDMKTLLNKECSMIGALMKGDPNLARHAGKYPSRIVPETFMNEVDDIKYISTLYAWWGFRIDLLDKIGSIDERLNHGEDQDFIIRARIAGELAISKAVTIDHTRNLDDGGGCPAIFGGVKERKINEEALRVELFNKYFLPKYSSLLNKHDRGFKVIQRWRLHQHRQWFQNGKLQINEYDGVKVVDNTPYERGITKTSFD